MRLHKELQLLCICIYLWYILFLLFLSMFLRPFHKKAFTLVEMLIVIVIIGILAAALIPRFSQARERANDTARKANLQQVAAVLVAYQIDRGSYPVDS
jgi:general secretion pathway protein G